VLGFRSPRILAISSPENPRFQCGDGLELVNAVCDAHACFMASTASRGDFGKRVFGMSELEIGRVVQTAVRFAGRILSLAVIAGAGWPQLFASEPLPTPLETSNFSRPSTSAEVSSYLASLAARYPQARVESLGTSVLGRPLEALVLTGASGADVAQSDRVTVEIIGSQHGMEGAGAESLVFFARELFACDLRHVIEDV
jgi:hypothetical protein